MREGNITERRHKVIKGTKNREGTRCQAVTGNKEVSVCLKYYTGTVLERQMKGSASAPVTFTDADCKITIMFRTFPAIAII